jgi:hypothetical protein
MKNIKSKLLPFAVLDNRDLRIDIGQEIPKQITMIASNSCAIFTASFLIIAATYVVLIFSARFA